MELTTLPGRKKQAQNLTELHPLHFHCSGLLCNIGLWSYFKKLVLTCAILFSPVKRFCEPLKHRRSWLVWFYDTSKQVLGAALVHFANVILAGEFTGDPCTWWDNFLMFTDSIILYCIVNSKHIITSIEKLVYIKYVKIYLCNSTFMTIENVWFLMHMEYIYLFINL